MHASVRTARPPFPSLVHCGGVPIGRSGCEKSLPIDGWTSFRTSKGKKGVGGGGGSVARFIWPSHGSGGRDGEKEGGGAIPLPRVKQSTGEHERMSALSLPCFACFPFPFWGKECVCVRVPCIVVLPCLHSSSNGSVLSRV